MLSRSSSREGAKGRRTGRQSITPQRASETARILIDHSRLSGKHVKERGPEGDLNPGRAFEEHLKTEMLRPRGVNGSDYRGGLERAESRTRWRDQKTAHKCPTWPNHRQRKTKRRKSRHPPRFSNMKGVSAAVRASRR